MKPLNVLSLFDGISCGQLALERAEIPVANYFASEIDKHAIKVTKNNFPNTIHIGDVSKVSYKDGVLYTENEEYEVEIDLILAGSPCQGFSVAGKGLAFDDPRSCLYFEFERILNEINPKWFLLENVNMKKEYRDIIDSRLGVNGVKINSSLVSAQNRVRWYWSNLDIEQPEDRGIMLKDIIGIYNGVYVIPRGTNKGGVKDYKGKSPRITTSAWQHNFFIYKKNPNEFVDRDKSYCLDASYYKGGNLNQYFNKARRQLVFNECGDFRKFTVNECEQLQTLPINYTEGVSDSQRYKAIGNGWTVDVIVHILNGINN